MLQQTQVRTVVPYFRRWLRRFPSLRSLARAPVRDVLKAWEGLGYYRRARMMHEAARIVVEKMGGRIPHTSQELRRLPGIGDYTAAAIASMAFGESVVAVDGNVRRVACRLLALEGGVGARRLKTELEALLPEGEAGRFNEALMELGALVCTPDRPLCGRCPLRTRCCAFLTGRVRELPPPAVRKPARRVEAAALVRMRKNSVYLKPRPPGGLLGGLWGFPLVDKAGLKTLRVTFLRPLRHLFSHVALTAVPALLTGAAGPMARELRGGKYCSPDDIARLPLSRLDRKILDAVMESGHWGARGKDAG